MDAIATTKVLSIAECGYHESWLRDRIYDDPSILGLGELQAVMREKTQCSGGRLDLLLKNPVDDSMYEVELQLGATDESHIIRTIEYWGNEKRRWPSRSHTAVLVAEEITSRFFNVVQLLSMAVPIVGIQANVVEVAGTKALHFTKMIDSYEEPEEDETPQQAYDEKYWVDHYPGTLECARWYKELLSKGYGEIPTKYFENGISLLVGGIARVWVSRRRNDRAFIEVKYAEGKIEEAVDYLNKEGVTCDARRDQLRFNVNLQQLKDKQSVHDWLVHRLAPQYLTQTANAPVGLVATER
ncbi:MAG: hypothetical protein ABSG68_12265 [Thermoguttaceae bacterium]|jgi:hypothetical protein